MPDPRDLSLHRWGEDLRRRRAVRKTCCRQAVLAAAAAAALAATLIWPPRPLLVWNMSASSPPGPYLLSSADRVEAGDFVAAWPPAAARRLAAERRYLPVNIPLVKRVAATRGDRVCAIGEAVFVNGRLAAARRRQDRSGRLLPWWTGCSRLRRGELLLLTRGGADSFDGRYFGISSRHHVIGRASPLWPA